MFCSPFRRWAINILDQQYEEVPLSRLKLHPRNARQGDIGLISESILENGFYGACVAQRSTGHILVGNHRYLAAKGDHAETVPVLWVDVDDERALKILLVDNRANDAASYDVAALADLLTELAEAPCGLSGTGYDGDDLDAIIDDLAKAISANDLEDATGHDANSRKTMMVKWPGGEAPLTEDEANRLTQKLDAHQKEAGVAYGFVGSLLK